MGLVLRRSGAGSGGAQDSEANSGHAVAGVGLDHMVASGGHCGFPRIRADLLADLQLHGDRSAQAKRIAIVCPWRPVEEVAALVAHGSLLRLLRVWIDGETSSLGRSFTRGQFVRHA